MDRAKITAALAEPFAAGDVKYKPQSVKGNRALALPYIDARHVEERLDAVVGVAGWQDDYTTLPDGSVICRLSVKLGEEWVTKMDVGSPSEQPDGGDRLKAAFSDALKRAAVKFGVGRYLYRLPPEWRDYDPVKKQFVQQQQPAQTSGPQQQAKASAAPPKTGQELLDRAFEYERKSGDRLKGMADRVFAAVAAEYGRDVARWGQPAIALGVRVGRSIVEQANAAAKPAPASPPPPPAKPRRNDAEAELHYKQLAAAGVTPVQYVEYLNGKFGANYAPDVYVLDIDPEHRAAGFGWLIDLGARAKARKKADADIRKPAKPDREEFQERMTAAGFDWANVVAQINSDFGTGYTQRSTWDEVAGEHLASVFKLMADPPADEERDRREALLGMFDSYCRHTDTAPAVVLARHRQTYGWPPRDPAPDNPRQLSTDQLDKLVDVMDAVTA